MAASKCPKCDTGKFECTVNEPLHSNHKVTFIQCQWCGTVVGVLEGRNLGFVLDRIESKLDAIAAKLGIVFPV